MEPKAQGLRESLGGVWGVLRVIWLSPVVEL
jgi:hypothetical protein